MRRSIAILLSISKFMQHGMLEGPTTTGHELWLQSLIAPHAHAHTAAAYKDGAVCRQLLHTKVAEDFIQSRHRCRKQVVVQHHKGVTGSCASQ